MIIGLKKMLVVLAALAGIVQCAFAVKPIPFKTVLYGVSYYCEYMPYERLEAGRSSDGTGRDQLCPAGGVELGGLGAP